MNLRNAHKRFVGEHMRIKRCVFCFATIIKLFANARGNLFGNLTSIDSRIKLPMK
jgi:hypothetical protein